MVVMTRYALAHWNLREYKHMYMYKGMVILFKIRVSLVNAHRRCTLCTCVTICTCTKHMYKGNIIVLDKGIVVHTYLRCGCVERSGLKYCLFP